MNLNVIQEMLRTVRSGQIQQILAAVLAIITAIGGIGVVGSSNGTNGGGGTSIVDEGTKAPVGEGVPLATVHDTGDAVKGKVTVGGKTYDNAWKFESGDAQYFQLNGKYDTLRATVVFLDGASQAERTFHIGGDKFTLNKDNPSRNIRINVTNVTKLRARAWADFALINARLY